MATYLELWSELKTYVPKLDITLSQKLVNRAWKDIRESRFWSFLVAETVIAAPAAISTGVVTPTQGSPLVTGDAQADAAWAAIGADITNRQFRTGMGPLYNIIAYASPTLTLDRDYAEVVTPGGGVYYIYKCYYPEPAANFLRWISVVDPVDGYRLATNRVKSELDLRDPLRGAVAQPYVIAAYKVNTAGTHLFELYPHPTIQRTYPALYQTRGTDFTDDSDTLPYAIPDEVLINRSKYYAYEWAMANSAHHSELRGTNWQYLRTQANLDYKLDLEKAKKQDEEIFLQNYTESYLLDRFRRFSYDGNYAQTHDVGWMWYR